MKTSNPALRDNIYRDARVSGVDTERMTIGGTVNKSFFLIAITLLSACWSWQQTMATGQMPVWIFPGMIAGFVVSLIIIFKQTTAPYLAPVYAIGEGLFLGGITMIFETRYPGIAIQAILCTMGTFMAMLISYKTGMIQATEGFKRGVFAATAGIALAYLVEMIMHMFGVNIPFIHSTGTLGVLISLVVVSVAALNLILDFDFIEQGARMGAPKYMEWYSAFGLLVTLVWLYLEMLRLLSKLRER